MKLAFTKPTLGPFLFSTLRYNNSEVDLHESHSRLIFATNIAEILLKLSLNTNQSINQTYFNFLLCETTSNSFSLDLNKMSN